MHKLTIEMRTGNRICSKRVVVTIISVLAVGIFLGLGSIATTSKFITGNRSSAEVFAEKMSIGYEPRGTEQFEHDDQIIISSHVKSAKGSRQAAAFQEFTRDIDLAANDIDLLNPGVDAIIERLTSLKTCLVLTYFMAKDFITGGSDVNKIFTSEVEELDRVTNTSVNKATLAIEKLSKSLQMIEGRYTESYIAGPGIKGVATGLSEDGMDGAVSREIGRFKLVETISFHSSAGSASAILSATAIGHTVTRIVWSYLGVVEQRTASRMAIAAVPAIIDGPLPVGDMITLALESGCLVWSFHEVYKAQGVLKDDLKRELTGVIKQNSLQLRQWAMSVGNELMEAATFSTPSSKIAVKGNSQLSKGKV